MLQAPVGSCLATLERQFRVPGRRYFMSVGSTSPSPSSQVPKRGREGGLGESGEQSRFYRGGGGVCYWNKRGMGDVVVKRLWWSVRMRFDKQGAGAKWLDQQAQWRASEGSKAEGQRFQNGERNLDSRKVSADTRYVPLFKSSREIHGIKFF